MIFVFDGALLMSALGAIISWAWTLRKAALDQERASHGVHRYKTVGRWTRARRLMRRWLRLTLDNDGHGIVGFVALSVVSLALVVIVKLDGSASWGPLYVFHALCLCWTSVIVLFGRKAMLVTADESLKKGREALQKVTTSL